jgi:hypothetical protein
MTDIAETVSAHLRSLPFLMERVEGNIFYDMAPAGTTEPFVVVRPLTDTPTFVDVPVWSDVTVSVDVVGRPQGGDLLSDLVATIRREVEQMRGKRFGSFSIQGVDPISAAYSRDSSSTPALPRWILTVPMIVRNLDTNRGVVT